MERIQDHRGDWLERSEPILLDEGRGIVTPVAHGVVAIVSKNDLEWLIDVSWNSQEPRRYRLQQPGAAQGRLERIAHPKDTP